MSEIQEITVTIGPDGKVDIEVHGVTGPQCEAITAELEQKLGGTVLERRHKDSFHQSVDQEQDTLVSQNG